MRQGEQSKELYLPLNGVFGFPVLGQHHVHVCTAL